MKKFVKYDAAEYIEVIAVIQNVLCHCYLPQKRQKITPSLSCKGNCLSRFKPDMKNNNLRRAAGLHSSRNFYLSS
jgi:hypothetical protein